MGKQKRYLEKNGGANANPKWWYEKTGEDWIGDFSKFKFNTADKETLFLPMSVNGIDVLQNQGDDFWLVDNSKLQSVVGGLAFRRSKSLADRHSDEAPYGTIVQGIVTEDGWLQTQQEIDVTKTK